MYRDDEFELNFVEEEDDDASDALEALRPLQGHRAFDWQKDATGDLGEPEEGGTTFRFEPAVQQPKKPETAATKEWPADPGRTFVFDVPLDDAPAKPFAYDVPLDDAPAKPFAYDVPLGESRPFAYDVPLDDPAPAQQSAPAAEPQPEPVDDVAKVAEEEISPAPQRTEPFSAPVAHERVRCGRTVLISGGDRGIGAAAARAFWRAGYNTAILYHTNEAAARALVNELGCDCAAVCCDVASFEECEAAFRLVEKNFGQVDVLVSNAGIAQQKLFTDITPAEWQRMLDVNLTGAFNLSRAALPGMIRRRWGRILTVSSMWGQTGGSCEVHYSAAKAGLIGFTKALAKEEGPSGVTVNCVAPGVIDTDMMAGFSAEDKAALAEETPVGRLGTPDEVAGMLVYLAGEGAGFITGQVFGVNGGLVT